MKCNICEHEADKGSLIHGIGFVCSEDCGQIAQGRRKKFHDELTAEPLGEMPEQFETHDFERWTLKFAVRWLRDLSDSDRERLIEINPLLSVPEELALDFKEKILRHIEKRFVSSVDHRGHDRLFSGGTYCFRQPVPQAFIIAAAKKAHLLA